MDLSMGQEINITYIPKTNSETVTMIRVKPECWTAYRDNLMGFFLSVSGSVRQSRNIVN